MSDGDMFGCIAFVTFMGLGILFLCLPDRSFKRSGFATIEVTLIIASVIWHEHETLRTILWIVAGLFAIFGLGKRLIAKMKYRSDVRKTQKYVSFYNDTLKVYQRTEKFKNILGMIEHKSSRMAHKDAEYIYTSVTVGGVTTGGVSKIGDYDYFTAEKNSGRWELWYDGHMVKQIELTDELARQAKNSSLISGYISGNTIYVVNPNAKPTLSNSDWLELNRRNSIMGMNILLDDNDKQYPRLEKCNAIVRWLCGDVPESDEKPNP